MASTSQMQAILERLKEVTRQKNPGVDIMKKAPKPKAARKPRKKKLLAPLCDDCGIYRSDPPSKLCPGCHAYKEHMVCS